MAGGTGGHVFPALAVADELRNRAVRVSWLGTRRGIEARVVPEASIDIDWIDVRGVRGAGGLSRIGAPFRIARALWQAIMVMRRRRPSVVLGMGGFAAGPGGLAARLLGRPLVIHEQNSVAGLTNRLLARVATRVLCAFPNAFSAASLRNGEAELVGNPLRAAFIERTEPEVQAANTTRPPRLLVIGGSQGAVALNQKVPEALAQLGADARPDIRHQCGERHVDAARAAYAERGVTADVVPFIDDMAAAYRWADLVICRAGALTIAELAASGVAGILIPFPFAVDDHQTGNARLLADAGAALLVHERDLTADSLADQLGRLLSSPERLQDMADRARRLARPDATRAVADILAAYLPAPSEGGV
ncbi:MAG: undecaprenyldiphospho-muramoylpentapeptide beta-N-acetylglucosaminyltransferase [Pseudomonadota bacterium]